MLCYEERLNDSLLKLSLISQRVENNCLSLNSFTKSLMKLHVNKNFSNVFS